MVLGLLPNNAWLMGSPKYINWLYYWRYFDSTNDGHGPWYIKNKNHGSEIAFLNMVMELLPTNHLWLILWEAQNILTNYIK
jgi:hypothetical protein